jgi:hypothetical protein
MRYLFCLLLCFTGYFAAGQDSVATKMKWYAKAKPTSNLFVHYDKNVYSNNETIYFTAYLIDPSINPSGAHKTLAVDVISDIDSSIVATDRFIMDKGLSFGNINLPDSILTGNYHIVAYTDQLINGIPELIFIQSITIKTNIDPAFKASMKLLEAANTQNKMHKVLVSATTKDNRFLPKPISVSYRYGDIYKTAKTDASGQVLINLPIQNNLTNPNLYVKLKNGKDSCFIQMPLANGKDKAIVRFYPEGGHLVLGLPVIVGWEVKDQQKMPIALSAYLYNNNKAIDTIETNSLGVGKFRLQYEKGANYTVKLVHNGLVDSVYQLPAAIPNGISLSVIEALAKDTLRVTLKTTEAKNVFIRLHNFRETFLYVPFEMDLQGKVLKIPLTEIPKGLATLTITDEQNRPLAERMIFAHYNNDEQLNLSTDAQIYKQREKVNLKLTLNNKDDDAVVSISVLQDNRLELKKMNDIESYTYLKNELASFPLHAKGLPYKDKAFLEQILLIRGWRKYSWEGMNSINPNDTIVRRDSLTITGLVSKGNKKITKEIEVIAFGDAQIRLVQTIKGGFFNVITPEFMATNAKKMYLFVNIPNRYDLLITLNDSFIKMSESLKKVVARDDVNLPSTLLNNSDLLLKSNEKSIRLKEVVIKSTADNSFFGSPGANACGDYVCRNNVLNCKNHPSSYEGTTQPIQGRTYAGLFGPYQECKEMPQGYVKLNGVHVEKEFYINDYHDPQEPAFFSTLYWNYATMLKGGTPTEISFHTSDITGKFRIVVQGISNKDVVYGEKYFEVKAKP